MKILFINNVYPDDDNPAAFVFVHQQARALQNAGYDICVLDIDLRSYRWKRKLGIYHEIYDDILVFRVSIPFVTTKLRRLGRFLNEKIGVRMAKKIFQYWGKAELVHAHFGFGAGDAGAAIKKKYSIPLIITEHSSKIISSKNFEDCSYMFSSYHCADKVICVGHALEGKVNGFGFNNTVLIPNIIDSRRFSISGRKTNEKYTFISVGHLIKRKNHVDLIKAFSLINEHNEYKLVIIGKGEEKEKLISLCKELKCSEDVLFVDRVPNDQLVHYFHKADCFVLPSLFETFGVVYAEAISSGIPAIGYRNGGAEDIIDESVGLLVEDNSVDSLAKTMLDISHKHYNPTYLHDYICERYGTEAFINAISHIYSEALNSYRT